MIEREGSLHDRDTANSEVAAVRIGDVIIESQIGVITATIDRPETRNAINDGVIDGLAGAVDAATRMKARVLVIRGAGGTFCSGADLKHTSQLLERGHDAVEEFVTRIADVLARLERAPFATIAAVEGFAVAGGFELLLACDLAVASKDARIGDRHLEYGVLPGAGGSARLLRTLPRARARYLLLTGEMIDGAKAAEWGLITSAVEPMLLDQTLDALVKRLATRSVDALAAVKRMTIENGGLDIAGAVENERRISREYSQTSEDRREGLAAFREKRAPKFRRHPPTVGSAE